MASTTIFKNFAVAVENKSLIVISNWIASDMYKSEVEEIQSLIAQGKGKEATEKKTAATSFHTFSYIQRKKVVAKFEAIQWLCAFRF